MEIVSVGSTEKTFSKEGAFSSCSNVEQLLFERAIGEAAEKILTDIFPDYQPKPKVEKRNRPEKFLQRRLQIIHCLYSKGLI